MNLLSTVKHSVADHFREHDLFPMKNGINKALIKAVKEGKEDQTAKLLKKEGIQIDFQDKEKLRTPLHFAASRGNRAVAALLLANHAKVDPLDILRLTPLHLASSNGQADIVKLLLEFGALLNARSESSTTPLHFAAAKGKVKTITVLTEARDIEIDPKNNKGYTPLHLAANKGHKEAVLLLIQKGADINAKIIENSWTPLHVAVLGKSLEVISALVNHGAIIEESAIKLALENGYTGIASYLKKKNPTSREICRETVVKIVKNEDFSLELDKAKLAIRTNKYSDAVEILKKALVSPNLEPNIRIAMAHQLGFCYLVEGRKYKAKEQFKNLIECLKKQVEKRVLQELPFLYLQLAYHYLIIDSRSGPALKVEDYMRLAKRSGEELQAAERAKLYANLGIIYYNALQMEKAKEYLEKAFYLNSNLESPRYREILEKAKENCSREQLGFKLKKKEKFFYFQDKPQGFEFEILKIIAERKDEDDFEHAGGIAMNGKPTIWKTTYKTVEKYTDKGYSTRNTGGTINMRYGLS